MSSSYPESISLGSKTVIKLALLRLVRLDYGVEAILKYKIEKWVRKNMPDLYTRTTRL